MKHLYRLFLFITLVSLCSFNSYANDAASLDSADVQLLKKKPLDWCLGFHFANSVPQKEFYSNLGNAGLGFMINGSGWLKNTPLAIGGVLGFVMFSYDEHYYNYRDGWLYDEEDVLTTSMTEIPLALTLRFQPSTNWLRPYFEGIAGGNFIITSADYESYSGYDDSSEGKFSATWFYGFGAGIDFRILNYAASNGGRATLNLTFAINYYNGSNVKYYTVDAYNDMTVSFHPYKSKTDQIVTLVGVTLGF